MRSITCFACHEHGHIVAYYKIKKIHSNQQKMQQMNILPQTTLSARERYYFHGYCFYCKGFGHKAMECKAYIDRFNYGNSRGINKNDGFTHVQNLFRNTIKCFRFHKNGHKSNECPLKYYDTYPLKGYRENNCMQWKRKLNKFYLALIDQDLKNPWYAKSGCSKHITETEASL